MHDAATKTPRFPSPRKANDCIPDPSSFKSPAKLFDHFWREGELALFFGASGTGKTVLALQIADALASGEPIEGLEMPEQKQRVLYVDLVHSDAQFHLKRMDDAGNTYRFPEYLDRDAPPPNAELLDWLENVVRTRRYRIVIIDDVSAIRMTCDGAKETLKLIRGLRHLTRKYGIATLLVSEARAPRYGESLSESNLNRSRILCDAADSVFAIGLHPRHAPWLYIRQLRSHTARLHWNNTDVAPHCLIKRRADGLLAMQFDCRFEPAVDDETRRLICLIKHLRDSGSTIRSIAAQLSFTKSRTERLLRKWGPSMERGDFRPISDTAQQTNLPAEQAAPISKVQPDSSI